MTGSGGAVRREEAHISGLNGCEESSAFSKTVFGEGDDLGCAVPGMLVRKAFLGNTVKERRF